MKRWIPFLVLVALLIGYSGWAFWPASAARAAASTMPTHMLVTVAGKKLVAEVARTPEQRRFGLMEKTALALDRGMLFDFRDVDKPCFWMKNTPLPLSAAWIDRRGKVLGVVEMTPQSLERHCAPRDAWYGIEANTGFFDETMVGQLSSSVVYEER